MPTSSPRDRIATWNMGDGPDHRKVTDLHMLADTGATIIGLQEAADRWDAIDDFLDGRPGWRVWRPTSPGAASVPVLYDARYWRVRRLRTVVAVASRWVGPGAGPSRAKGKAVNVVALKQRHGPRRSRDRVRILNTHMIASATRRGHQFDPRRDHYRDHMRVLVRMVRAGRLSRTIVTGDLNATPTSPLVAPLHAVGLVGWTQAGTHGHRPIDHILVGPGRPTERRTLGTSSDHTAVLADLTPRTRKEKS